jgi:hypothetical protein
MSVNYLNYFGLFEVCKVSLDPLIAHIRMRIPFIFMYTEVGVGAKMLPLKTNVKSLPPTPTHPSKEFA